MTIGTCPACGEPHAAAAQICSACGEPLSSVARMLAASTARPQPRWLEQSRQRASGLRRAEADASDQRMQALLETDRRRQTTERETAARTTGRERRAILMAGVLLFVMAVILGTALLLVLD